MTPEFSRRQFVQAAGVGALLASVGQQALAQAQIENLRIVTGFAAGGTSDAMCRRVASKLGSYAKTTVVDNKTGAGGQIAIQTVKALPPDGTTLLQTPTSMLTIYPHIYKKLAYDPMVDLTPVSTGCIFDSGLAVGPMVPASVKNVADFLAWAKAHPSQANFGSPAAGSTPHFLGALVGQSGGVDLKHAAYRGTQPAMLDLLSGNIAAVSGPVGDLTLHLSTGKVRILGTSGAKRSRFTPDVPTFTEQGMKNMAHSEWFAFFLPAKAAPDLVNRINAALKIALAQQEVIDGLATFGLEAQWSTPAELGDIVRRETAKWGPIVKAVGFSAEG